MLEIGRANRPDIYNLRFRKQPPFVPRELRFEVSERMNYKGEVVTPLDLASVDAVAERIAAPGCDAVAVCFLHSYANPTRTSGPCADRLRELSAGRDGHRLLRDHPRVARVRAHQHRRAQRLRAAGRRRLSRDHCESSLRDDGIGAPLDVMKSNGGTATFAVS